MTQEKMEDLLAAFQLNPLTEGGIYLPFSNSSLRYSSIAVLLNDIVINKRKFIIELGSGLTSILISKLIKTNKLAETKFVTIDEDEKWQSLVKDIVRNQGCSDFVSFINAPLTQCDVCKPGQKWYNTQIITDALKGSENIVDCILVDGPSAWHKEIELARYPALPFFHPYLNKDSIIFLDDTNRNGEKTILKEWADFGMKRIEYSSTFSALIKGEMFNISI